jgi:hypothetical protein
VDAKFQATKGILINLCTVQTWRAASQIRTDVPPLKSVETWRAASLQVLTEKSREYQSPQKKDLHSPKDFIFIFKKKITIFIALKKFIEA